MFARLLLMVFLICAVVMVCALVGWLVLYLGVEVVQALLAVALMVIAWHMLRRRPNMTIADDFKAW